MSNVLKIQLAKGCSFPKTFIFFYWVTFRIPKGRNKNTQKSNLMKNISMQNILHNLKNKFNQWVKCFFIPQMSENVKEKEQNVLFCFYFVFFNT
jgi:hypothetical protein